MSDARPVVSVSICRAEERSCSDRLARAPRGSVFRPRGSAMRRLMPLRSRDQCYDASRGPVQLDAAAPVAARPIRSRRTTGVLGVAEGRSVRPRADLRVRRGAARRARRGRLDPAIARRKPTDLPRNDDLLLLERLDEGGRPRARPHLQPGALSRRPRCVMHASTYVEEIDMKQREFCDSCLRHVRTALQRL